MRRPGAATCAAARLAAVLAGALVAASRAARMEAGRRLMAEALEAVGAATAPGRLWPAAHAAPPLPALSAAAGGAQLGAALASRPLAAALAVHRGGEQPGAFYPELVKARIEALVDATWSTSKEDSPARAAFLDESYGLIVDLLRTEAMTGLEIGGLPPKSFWDEMALKLVDICWRRDSQSTWHTLIPQADASEASTLAAPADAERFRDADAQGGSVEWADDEEASLSDSHGAEDASDEEDLPHLLPGVLSTFAGSVSGTVFSSEEFAEVRAASAVLLLVLVDAVTESVASKIIFALQAFDDEAMTCVSAKHLGMYFPDERIVMARRVIETLRAELSMHTSADAFERYRALCKRIAVRGDVTTCRLQQHFFGSLVAGLRSQVLKDEDVAHAETAFCLLLLMRRMRVSSCHDEFWQQMLRRVETHEAQREAEWSATERVAVQNLVVALRRRVASGSDYGSGGP